MQQITNVSIDILKVHPRNQEFYDDIEGDNYEKFKRSIQEDGILTPLIVSPDMTIISGHQRYKASKDLDLKLLPVIIREDLDTENEKLKKLLATNFGRLKNNPVKQGRVYSEYEKLCGIRQGSAGNSHPQIVGGITQEDIAKELGVSTETVRRLKKLQTLSPDLQQLVEDGSVKYTTALNIFSKLSRDEQDKLINDIGQNKIKEMTAKQIQQYIEEKRQLENENQELQKCFNELSNKYNALENIKSEVEDLKKQLQAKPKEVIKEVTVEKEVIPSDYIDLKNKMKEKDKYYNDLKREYDSKIKQMFDLEDEIRSMKEKSESENYTKKLQDSALIFCTRVHSFIETSSGLAWLAEHINELPQYEKNSYIKAVRLMEDWVLAVKSNMKQYV